MGLSESPWDLGIEGLECVHANRTRTRFRQGILVGVLALVLVVLSLGMLAMGAYAYYARSLPEPGQLHERAATFQSSRIYDRRGRLLYEVMDPTAGKRSLVQYEELSAHMVHAVIATEDASFFAHPGINPLAIGRALVADVMAGEVVQGGSTITQQVVKNLYLTPERTIERKIKEAILATELTRRYSKVEILETYLNEVYFGHLAYGIGAAADTYFEKRPADLELHEAALLAALIQAPALHDPYTNPSGALLRRTTVLRRMREEGYISASDERGANAESLGVVVRRDDLKAPHMTAYVREQLEASFGTERLYRGGLQVYTTLDLQMQAAVEEIVAQHMPGLRSRGANNAAVLVLDARTGEILAMVGSADFDDIAIDGQVNVTRRMRQPGSTIKPFVYLAAMESGAGPGTMLMDVRQTFDGGSGTPYVPLNHDLAEMGPISMRTALACSRNIPAVATLDEVGLPVFLDVCRRAGITTLGQPHQGLALALGAGEVPLLEMAGAYAVLANGGWRVTPQAVLRVETGGTEISGAADRPAAERVLDPRHAYLVSDILADDGARLPTFGQGNPLELPFWAAVKTGTTQSFRDSMTIGYTPQVVVAVWVGNSDGSATDGVSGAQGAGPIWHDVMLRAVATRPTTAPERPDGIVEIEICTVSGARPQNGCPDTRRELFASDALPGACTAHVEALVCGRTGLLANAYCPSELVERRSFLDLGPEWDAWVEDGGQSPLPRGTCAVHTHEPRLAIRVETSLVSGVVVVRGSTLVDEFRDYRVEYSQATEPLSWQAITPWISAPVEEGVLCTWDALKPGDGAYTLRLVVRVSGGIEYRAQSDVTIVHQRTATLTSTPLTTLTETRESASPTHDPTAELEITAEPQVTPGPPLRSTAQPAYPSPAWRLPTHTRQPGMVSETPRRPPRR